MAWSPISIKIKSDHPESYKSFYADLLIALLIIMIFCSSVLSLFSGEIVELLIGDEYQGSSYPLIFLCFGVAINTSGQITATGISIEKKTFLFARIAWFSVLINAVLNWILIREYGAIGASLSTLFCHFFITCSYLYYTQKLHFIPFQYSRIVLILILALIMILLSLYIKIIHLN